MGDLNPTSSSLYFVLTDRHSRTLYKVVVVVVLSVVVTTVVGSWGPLVVVKTLI